LNATVAARWELPCRYAHLYYADSTIAGNGANRKALEIASTY
jgi:hypothetical protein